MDATARDPRQLLDDATMSPAQVAAVAMVCALSALDGYDVLALSFAAPGITAAWGISKGALGLVLSSGLVGMAFGSIVVAPLADLYGRRKLVVASLALMAVGMALSALASSVTILAAWRVVTGIGIGAMVPIATPLAVEFANRRRRALAMAMFAVGYPLGGTIGGFGAALLLRSFAWPSVFLLGALLSAMMVPLVLLFLPEPLVFLLARRDGGTLARVNLLLARCRLPAVEVLPPDIRVGKAPYRAIFAPGQAGRTLRITLVNLLYLMCCYYALAWLPQIVTDAGFTPSAGTALSAIASLSGTLVCISLSLAAPGLRLRRLATAMMFGLGLATIGFGLVPAQLVLLGLIAALIGGFLFTGIFGLYSTIVDTFPPDTRATGAGFVMGVGRAASALSPAIAGGLFTLGAGRLLVSVVLGALALLAGLILATGRED